ncbi:DNA modification methylase [Limibacillus sp. MBR-115]|jgi:DNA modification methylase|uniref:DNA modification methylase n=1 Tax=Limibacillus sp. MBR-115 TaxID=3156465 RepID=UPI003398781C
MSKRLSGHNGGPPLRDLSIEGVAIKDLAKFKTRTRRHSAKQRLQMKRILLTYGQVLPIPIDRQNRIIDGELLVDVAQELGLATVQAVRIDNLTELTARALRLALNKIAEGASWDDQALSLEFTELLAIDSDFDLTLNGFDTGEIDLHLQSANGGTGLAEEALPVKALDGPPVTQPGDVWMLGEHRLCCGSALDQVTYEALLQGNTADLLLTDPPYNVPIKGHVSGKGKKTHREFAMASGEMDRGTFIDFLGASIGTAIGHCRKGALFYGFMDWRHLGQLEAACQKIGLEGLNLCVWVKTNPGMGSFYRSQHELIYLAKKPGAAHCNNIQLGRYGRNRSNVWTYPGANSFGNERDAMLAAHPTVKPAGLLADIIQDASHRGDLVLDPFAGSGSTLMAAEMMGRRAALIEIDPCYCDLILQRYQLYRGRAAQLIRTGETFAARKVALLASHEGESNA